MLHPNGRTADIKPGDPDEEHGESRPLSALDLGSPIDRRSRLRKTPRLAYEALAIVWEASRRHFVTTFLLQVASGVGTAVVLLVTQKIMQELIAVSHGASADGLYAPFGLLVVLTCVLGLVSAFTAHEQALLGEMVGRHAFDRIIGVSNSVDYRLFETSEFYDQLQRARASGEFRTVEMVNSIIALLTAVLTTGGIAVVLFLLDPLLIAFVVVAAIPPLLAALRNSREAYAFEYAMTPESRERAYMVDLLTERASVKEVRLFNLGSHLRDRYRALTDERLLQLRAFLHRRLVVTVLGTVAGAAGTAMAFGALVALLATQRIDVAAALTAGVAMQQLGGRLTMITAAFGRLIESGMFIDDYKTFLRLSEKQMGSAKTMNEQLPRFTGLKVEGVSFAYPNAATPTLEDVSLEIAPGEIVALVGENGSGKTTLVKLICQLYRPAGGQILWSGVDAASLEPESVQSEISVLFQDFIQYHLTALDNIAFGRIDEPASRGDAVAAAARAGADEFLSDLPNGYDTRLGLQFFGGHELSVGQWQRLALARVFFRGGDFLILDEPTAAVDPRAERELFARMHALSAGRAVLLISHRFSSVRTADRIYVLQNGRVAEAGTHSDLIAANGHYAELFNLSSDGEQLAEGVAPGPDHFGL